MAEMGALEAMAQADLAALVDEIERTYSPGALEALTAADPEWRAALDRTEREVGELYEALCRADAALSRWPEAVAELRRVWSRTGELAVGPEVAALDEVA